MRLLLPLLLALAPLAVVATSHATRAPGKIVLVTLSGPEDALSNGFVPMQY